MSAVGLEENHTIKETLHVYTHTHTHSYAAQTWSILYFVWCNASYVTFLFSTSVTEQPITNYTEAGTRLFSNLLVTSCKEDGGASRTQTHQSTSKVETELIY